MSTPKILMSLPFVCFLASCGGGGSGAGGTNNINNDAVVTVDNAQELSEAAIIATESSIASSDFNLGVFANLEATQTKTSAKAMVYATRKTFVASQFSAQVPETIPCSGGGSITQNFPAEIIDNMVVFPDSGSAEVRYERCVQHAGDPAIEGSVSISWSGGWSVEFGPRNITLVFDVADLASFSGSGSIVCTNYGDSCRYSDNFSAGGVDFQVSDARVSGDEQRGFNVHAEVSSSDQGRVTFDAEGVVPCEDGGFSSGNIAIFENNNMEMAVIEVEFTDCATYNITFDGEVTAHSL